MAREVPERWLVAFSLAGEQRELVRPVAEEVERRLGESTVFYDEWYEHYIAGAAADLELGDVYGERCELAVICISAEYGGKPWTQTEYDAVRARSMAALGDPVDRLRVLALRVGEGDVRGFRLNNIGPDIRNRSTQAAADLIVNRLDLIRQAALPRAAAAEWPDQAPEFPWPIADHSRAQEAFCALLTKGSPTRILLIEGGSETGKTHLGTTMQRNVAELLPGARSGRFDFKGSMDRGTQLEAFSRALGLEPEPSGQLTERFGSVLTRLQARPQPTVLIFDTYEDVGVVEQWVDRVLLEATMRLQWLRVIILGQRVPTAHLAPWESMCSPTIELQLPGPQDWYHYGRQQRPDAGITLEFVSVAHKLTHGRPAVLAGLLGPGR